MQLLEIMTISAFTSRRLFLAIEYILTFIAAPTVLFIHTTRWNIHLALWIASIYAVAVFVHGHRTSWPVLWHGRGWSTAHQKMALLRFLATTSITIIATALFLPGHLFGFPLQRPIFWLIVMILYPVLSVLPQEFVFRSFFFRRYTVLFGAWTMPAINIASFAFMHIVFHNVVAPLLCLAAGTLFTRSYQQHQSLKWSTIEHAAYGCMVFTTGIGGYFLVDGMSR